MSGVTKHRAIVFEWLSSIGLQNAIPKFKQSGITTPAQLMALGFDDFERIGIDALLDRKKLFYLVQKVKSAMNDFEASEAAKRMKASERAGDNVPAASSVLHHADNTTSAASMSQAALPAHTSSPTTDAAVPVQMHSACRKSADSQLAPPPTSVAGTAASAAAAAHAVSPTTTTSGVASTAPDAQQQPSPTIIPSRLSLLQRSPPVGPVPSPEREPSPPTPPRLPAPPPPRARGVRSQSDPCVPVRTSEHDLQLQGHAVEAATVTAGQRTIEAARITASWSRDAGVSQRVDADRDLAAAPANDALSTPSAGATCTNQIPSHARPPLWDSASYSMADRIRVVVRVRGGTVSERGNRAHTRAVSLDAGGGAGASARSANTDALSGSPTLSPSLPHARACVECVPPHEVLLHELKQRVDSRGQFTALSTHRFGFDNAFGPETTNDEIYRGAVRPLVAAAFGGGRSTVFAYGQTGSGKTFTMLGSDHGLDDKCSGQRPSCGDGIDWRRASDSATGTLQQHGMYLLAARDVFAEIQHPGSPHRGMIVAVSFFEIYGDRIFDLLALADHADEDSDGSIRRECRCLEDARAGQVVVAGLSEHHVTNERSLMQLVARGSEARRVGATATNARSSRSHAVLQVMLRASTPVQDIARTTHWSRRDCHSSDTARGALRGKLSFIDLAGSERGTDRDISGGSGYSEEGGIDSQSHRREGAAINKSLLALKECIRAMHRHGLAGASAGAHATQDYATAMSSSPPSPPLVSAGSPISGASSAHYTPFRGSKLTQVLKESLVGRRARTVMIATVAPSLRHCDHTLNTLRYAGRVKECRTGPNGGGSTGASTVSSAMDAPQRHTASPHLSPSRPLRAPSPPRSPPLMTGQAQSGILRRSRDRSVSSTSPERSATRGSSRPRAPRSAPLMPQQSPRGMQTADINAGNEHAGVTSAGLPPLELPPPDEEGTGSRNSSMAAAPSCQSRVRSERSVEADTVSKSTSPMPLPQMQRTERAHSGSLTRASIRASAAALLDEHRCAVSALAEILKDEMGLLNAADRTRTRKNTLEYIDSMDHLLQRKLSLVLGLRASLSAFADDYGCISKADNNVDKTCDKLLEEDM